MYFKIDTSKAFQSVTDYRHKKLIEYLKPGITALIEFPHGLGDDVMFMPLFLKLRELYPLCTIDLNVASGREDVFGIYKSNIEKYDYQFLITFPESHDYIGHYSKPEYCCLTELGIPFTKELDFSWQPPATDSHIIGVNFECNSNPILNVNYNVAKTVWNAIQDNGFIPIEIYFNHEQFNQCNQKYDFISATTRGVKPSVTAFTSVIRSCKAFVGVNSGSLCMAVATLPKGNVVHLHTKYPFDYYHKWDDTITYDATNITSFDAVSFFNYIKNLKQEVAMIE